MTLQPLSGFQSQPTHHCVTGSLHNIYTYHGHELSEEMLLGLGEGIGFVYWHYKGQPPFLGGRGNVGVGNQEGLEKTVGRRTGVAVEFFRTVSSKKAETSLIEMLSKSEPVMVYLDMGYLPYFNFDGQEYHFGEHSVVVCGVDTDSKQVLIADRDGLHPISFEALALARGSKYKPFPPQNQWFCFDFRQKRMPSSEEICYAIIEQANGMLEPPISNLGVRGIRKAADKISRWPEAMDEDQLRWALFNSYIMISAVGGTGGGNFRYMFSHYLQEASRILENSLLEESAEAFKLIGDRWEELSLWFLDKSEVRNKPINMNEGACRLRKLAEIEGNAWIHIRKMLRC